MGNEEALNICNIALKALAVKHSERNTPYEKEEFEKQISLQFDIRNMVEALEKQIPKKPKNAYRTIEGYVSEWTCPMCGLTYKRKRWENIWNHHCTCGQAIDWSEE